MSYITLSIPPGIYRTGTDYSSKGRWFNANLWRWFSGEQRPVGGWVRFSDAATPMSGKARALLPWRDNTSIGHLGVGTNSKLYATSSAGFAYDITPTGFTTGNADASLNAAYGSGPYGSGTYGFGAVTDTVTVPAAMWSLDTWGEYLVGVMPPDSTIYEWKLNTSTKAQKIANSPSANSIVVTADRILMALGAAGNPRRVMWTDQENNTVWTSTDSNYAGEFDLQTPGSLVCGRRVSGATLLLTDVDAWTATFIGQPFVYSFNKVGSQCGIVAANAIITTDVHAYWMGTNGFWRYNGYCEPIPCEVHDYVFSDINRTQISKSFAQHISDFGEIWWFYPSADSSENNRYVVYNYREDHWNIGQLTRLAGCDKGVFQYPLMVDDSTIVYNHERGYDHGGATPFAESGPVEIGEGDNVLMVRRIIPDEKNLNNVKASFTAKFSPMGAGTPFGPYTSLAFTDVRFTGRQVAVKLNGTDGIDFRVGDWRFDVVQGGLR